nr:uncharacterized protein LOC100180871 [Ciona intestinalis]|eukprot:XP_018669562.1 uncharacterized protein LOC100180871 [Ciona intestinalis]
MCEEQQRGKGTIRRLFNKSGHIEPEFNNNATVYFTVGHTPCKTKEEFHSMFPVGKEVYFRATNSTNNIANWKAESVTVFRHPRQPNVLNRQLKQIRLPLLKEKSPRPIEFPHRDPVITFLHDLLTSEGPLKPAEIGHRMRLINISKKENFKVSNKIILDYVADYAQYFQVIDNMVHWNHKEIVPCPRSNENAKSSSAALRYIYYVLKLFQGISLTRLKLTLQNERMQCPGSIAHLENQTDLLENILIENDFDYHEDEEYVFQSHVDPIINYLYQLLNGKERKKKMKFSEVAHHLREDGPINGVVPFEVSNRKLSNLFQEYNQYFEVTSYHVSWKFSDTIPSTHSFRDTTAYVSAVQFFANLMKKKCYTTIDILRLLNSSFHCSPGPLLQYLNTLKSHPSDFFVIENGVWYLSSYKQMLDLILSALASATKPYIPSSRKAINFAKKSFSSQALPDFLDWLDSYGLSTFHGCVFKTSNLVSQLDLTMSQLLTVVYYGKTVIRKQQPQISELSFKSAPQIVKQQMECYADIQQFLVENGFFFSVRNNVVKCNADDETELLRLVKKLLQYVDNDASCRRTTPTSDLDAIINPPILEKSPQKSKRGRNHRKASNESSSSISQPVQDVNERDDLLMSFAGARISQPTVVVDSPIHDVDLNVRKSSLSELTTKKLEPLIPETRTFMPQPDVYVNPTCNPSNRREVTSPTSEQETTKESNIFGRPLIAAAHKALYDLGLDPDRNLILIRLDVGKKPLIRYANYGHTPAHIQTNTLHDQPVVTDHQVAKILKHQDVSEAKQSLYGINQSLHYIRAVLGPSKISGLTWFYHTHLPHARYMKVDSMKFHKVTVVFTDAKVASINVALSYIRSLCEQYSTTTTLSANEVVVVDWDGQITGYGESPHPSVAKCLRLCGEKYSDQQHALKDAVSHHPDYVVAANIKTQESLQLVKEISMEGFEVVITCPSTMREMVEFVF